MVVGALCLICVFVRYYVKYSFNAQVPNVSISRRYQPRGQDRLGDYHSYVQPLKTKAMHRPRQCIKYPQLRSTTRVIHITNAVSVTGA